MRVLPLLIRTTLVVSIAASASAVTMAWTPIDNPGNACEPQPDSYGGRCYGAVGYTYSIGTYEVTNAQYAEFLSAKAKAVFDPLELYNTYMGSAYAGGITRSGSPGSYTYQGDTRPVNFVSFFDALRFANWMNNGKGDADTETGAYTLLGGTAVPSNAFTVARNSGATIVLASQDEWYKAAYYDPQSASYFDYPTGSNTPPTCSTPTATANRANCSGAVLARDILGRPIPGVAIPSAVGSYSGSSSPSGTFDQGGNVYEWAELNDVFPAGLRGGGFESSPAALAAVGGNSAIPTFEASEVGFRLAMIPEPSTGLLVIAGLLGIAARRRVRH